MRVAAVTLLALAASALLGCGSSQAQSRLYDPGALDSRPDLLAKRRATRAYDGAPPVIPHRVERIGRRNCSACHQPGSARNGVRVAPPRSHPAWGACVQCHLEQEVDSDFVRSNLDPLRWPDSGSRLTAISPPTVPHHIQNRENCVVCHIGERAPAALRASHGFRGNCSQCHLATVGAGVHPGLIIRERLLRDVKKSP